MFGNLWVLCLHQPAQHSHQESKYSFSTVGDKIFPKSRFHAQRKGANRFSREAYVQAKKEHFFTPLQKKEGALSHRLERNEMQGRKRQPISTLFSFWSRTEVFMTPRQCDFVSAHNSIHVMV